MSDPCLTTQPRTVAALYVDASGPYPSLPGVDPWDAARDAREYGGPHPVVAHPPCGPWGRYRHRCNQDPQLAIRAVEQVRDFGGVLEHPADSRLWRELHLWEPGEFPDRFGGWSLALEQGWWGHPAPKATWLYLVGVPRSAIVLPVNRPSVGPLFARREAEGLVENLAKSKRHLTPPSFARWLVELARHV